VAWVILWTWAILRSEISEKVSPAVGAFRSRPEGLSSGLANAWSGGRVAEGAGLLNASPTFRLVLPLSVSVLRCPLPYPLLTL